MAGNFRENLRSELNFQGLTVKELSSKTSIPKGTLNCYLSTRNSIPTADIAVKIASALGVSVEYLVTGEESSKTGQSPSKLRDINKDLEKLPKETINAIGLLVKTLRRA